ncbi:MAG: hypothetical protein PWR03_1144 [Tenuifilum sp.]|nr:hypothetical protein [Tenuifilum sp.]
MSQYRFCVLIKNITTMKKIISIHLLFLLILVLPVKGFSQVTTKDYERAEKFLQFNLSKHIYNSWVQPSWNSQSNSFIYSVYTRKGTEYLLVNPKTKKKKKAFDQEKLAQLLADSLKEEVKPFELPISQVKLEQCNRILFEAKSKTWLYDSEKNILQPKPDPLKLTSKESLSPDGKWVAFIKDGNIFIRDKKTGSEVQLSQDGTPENGYGYDLSWYFTRNDTKGEKNDYNIEVYWSKDSKKLIVPRYDRRNTRRLYLLKHSNEGYQGEVVSYERGLAGDSAIAMVVFYLFDVQKKNGVKIDLPTHPAFLGTYFYFFDNCPKAYHVRYDRGYKKRELFEIDLESGGVRSVLVESYPKTFVDIYTETLEVLYDNNEFIWRSEQDGWCHLYLYDLTSGKIKNQITKGEFYVYGVENIDAKNRKIWFTAGGVDKSRNPYQKYLYSINFNGKGLKLLTPEEATHSISISPDKRYFVDNYSSVTQPNIAVLRYLKSGKMVMELERSDINDLVEMGWKHAEPFSMLADDGKTMLYGVIFKPTNFDPNKKYPVIDGTYTGPHTIRSPQTFSRSVLNMDLSLAELGFIVVNIDGRGSAYRSKSFHDISYARLGYGLVDHVYVIKELAKKYPYIDADRVGIYGHSAGGYDATRALLLFPDFYKVGVSSAGDHDHRMEKVWWPELYQGYPVDTQYQNQSNITNAANLKGHLLLVTGDLDNNVNPSATIRLAEELTKANKDFDLIILPNNDHSSCYWNKYFIRRRWDFFVRHLLGQNPPKEYKIK